MYREWGLATHCSKANKEARLVERKAWMPAVAVWGDTPVQRLTPPNTDNQWTEGGCYTQKQHSQL